MIKWYDKAMMYVPIVGAMFTFMFIIDYQSKYYKDPETNHFAYSFLVQVAYAVASIVFLIIQTVKA